MYVFMNCLNACLFVCLWSERDLSHPCSHMEIQVYEPNKILPESNAMFVLASKLFLKKD